MATAFAMPKLGLTMEAGTILRWLVDDGSAVEAGTPVLEIETDKVESEVEASGSGRLHQTGVVGETYACGEQIGWFLADGEEAPAPAATQPAPAPAPVAAADTPPTAVAASAASNRTPSGRLRASPNARRVAAELGVAIATVAGTGPGGRIVSEDVRAAAAASPTRPVPAATSGVVATVAARQLADLLGVDLAELSPAGADPRISRDDVARHVRQRLAGAVPGPKPTAAPLAQAPTEVVALRGMRGTIAARMHESLHEMAQLTLTMDVGMDRVVADREARRSEGTAPGYTDYVIAAAARALVDHPVVNSQIVDRGVALLPDVNVGVAVALDDGLIVPVVHEANLKSIEELAAETSRLAGAARAGTLRLPELEGATFSVTALGMFGVDAFTPIVNPPNTAILGVGRIRREVAWDADERPVPARVLTLSLTWDHRAFDGAPAAEFARSVARSLEEWGER